MLHLERRKLETHARIRFNHRGQVAMALPLDETAPELEPQFFITLDEAPYLDKKHVVFGTVAASPTVFNALRIGNVEVNGEGQPVDWEHAPRILSTKVIQDTTTLVANPDVPWIVKNETTAKKKKKKRKGKRDTNVLSFGHDEEDIIDGVGGMQSSHDISGINDKKNKSVPNKDDKKVVDTPSQQPEEEPLVTRVEATEKEQQTTAPSPPPTPSVSNDKYSTAGPTQMSLDSLQETIATAKEKPHDPQTKKTSAVEAMRLRYKTKTKNKREREDDTMAKLLAFQNKVRVKQPKPSHNKKQDDNSLAARMAKRAQASNDPKEQLGSDGPTYHGQVLDLSDDDEPGKKEENWLETRFHCRQHMDQKAGDGRDMDDYLVDDERKKKHRGGPKHGKHGGQRKRHHRS